MIQVAKIIGTGLATTGLIGAGVGIGVGFEKERTGLLKRTGLFAVKLRFFAVSVNSFSTTSYRFNNEQNSDDENHSPSENLDNPNPSENLDNPNNDNPNSSNNESESPNSSESSGYYSDSNRSY
jgi:F-type H+-transporting ATPase subunit c